MALESASYINGLVQTNPLGSDPIASGDDHIRLIKATIKNTFPNITGPVTANQAQLNTAMPIGGVIMWPFGSIPAGWALCNGQTVARSDGFGNITTPNLMDRFIVGAGSGYGLAAAGGNAVITLTEAQMPNHAHDAAMDSQGHHQHRVAGNTAGVGDHSHSMPNNGSVQAGSDNGGANTPVSTGYSSGRMQAGTNPAGAHAHYFETYSEWGGDHTHNVWTGTKGGNAGIDIRPPFVALYYIMKV
jgi:microcystin-dependent protein